MKKYDQLSLLDYTPEPQEMAEPVELPHFEVGDRVTCPNGKGRIYHVSNSAVWVDIANTAKPYDPAVVRPYAPNPHAVEFWQAKAALCLNLMSRFQQGRLCSLEVCRVEISMLHQMRQECLNKLHQLQA